MHKGDKVSVIYIYSAQNKVRRTGIAEYISPHGWVTIQFENYLEGFWIEEVSG
jgi:hypothetical protein